MPETKKFLPHLLIFITLIGVISTLILHNMTPDMHSETSEPRLLRDLTPPLQRPARKRHKHRRGKNQYAHQYSMLDAHAENFDQLDKVRMLEFAKTQRKRRYEPIASMGYDVFDCPSHPPEGYPAHWRIMDIIENWNPDDTSPREKIYQGLCVFTPRDEEKALRYRDAEVPFVMRDDPLVLQAVERWAQPNYLEKLLNPLEKQRTEYNKAGNHFMFWRARTGKGYKGWTQPTENIKMAYGDWLEKARAPPEDLTVDKPHWYFRINGNICKDSESCQNGNEFIYEELPFFEPKKSFYMVEPKQQRGINCRFGMKGVIAENHFDGSRNFIVLMGGERRYILAHPDQCVNLCLYTKDHPSGRHSAVDWSEPDLANYPRFNQSVGNEIVLQAGDAMYLPTAWFHYIINLNLNWQCNARSGVSNEYNKFIHECGF